MREEDSVLRARMLSVVLSASVAALLLITAAAAEVRSSGLSGQPVIPPTLADQVRRVVDWTGYPKAAPTIVWIDSTSVGAPSPDEFQITYEHGMFSLEYERVAGGPVTSQFTVTVTGLVEWLPTASGNFSDGTLIGYTPLGPAAFARTPIVHSQQTTSSGIVVHSFLIRSDSGEVTMNLTISQGFAALPSGDTLTPMEGELTLQINHLMNRTDTQLTAQLGLTTDNPSQRFVLDNASWDDLHGFRHNEHAVNVTNNLPSGASSAFFAWMNHAAVNGQTIQVSETGPERNDTTGGYDLYLSYPRVGSPTNPDAIEVVHDPSLGVVSAAYQSLPGGPTGIQADIPLYVVTTAAVAALIGGTALLTRRRRKGEA